VGIGLNYRDHAKESGLNAPAEPVIFLKASTSLSGPNDGIPVPEHSTKLDWEVELAIVIGKRALNISEVDAPT
jgi:2-keto-4-pentenoate hydratase/2-oxohepta-3-ene-1,7-dioic acid hydratase in catechol pathway